MGWDLVAKIVVLEFVTWLVVSQLIGEWGRARWGDVGRRELREGHPRDESGRWQ